MRNANYISRYELKHSKSRMTKSLILDNNFLFFPNNDTGKEFYDDACRGLNVDNQWLFLLYEQMYDDGTLKVPDNSNYFKESLSKFPEQTKARLKKLVANKLGLTQLEQVNLFEKLYSQNTHTIAAIIDINLKNLALQIYGMDFDINSQCESFPKCLPSDNTIQTYPYVEKGELKFMAIYRLKTLTVKGNEESSLKSKIVINPIEARSYFNLTKKGFELQGVDFKNISEDGNEADFQRDCILIKDSILLSEEEFTKKYINLPNVFQLQVASEDLKKEYMKDSPLADELGELKKQRYVVIASSSESSLKSDASKESNVLTDNTQHNEHDDLLNQSQETSPPEKKTESTVVYYRSKSYHADVMMNSFEELPVDYNSYEPKTETINNLASSNEAKSNQMLNIFFIATLGLGYLLYQFIVFALSFTPNTSKKQKFKQSSKETIANDAAESVFSDDSSHTFIHHLLTTQNLSDELMGSGQEMKEIIRPTMANISEENTAKKEKIVIVGDDSCPPTPEFERQHVKSKALKATLSLEIRQDGGISELNEESSSANGGSSSSEEQLSADEKGNSTRQKDEESIAKPKEDSLIAINSGSLISDEPSWNADDEKEMPVAEAEGDSKQSICAL